MKKYIKDGVISLAKDIRIWKGGMITYNPSEKMILADGWEVYTDPEPSLDFIKRRKIQDILAYDSSDSVNAFSIGEVELWLDKATRSGLMLRFQAEKALGEVETTLWHDGMAFPLDLEIAFQMLYAIEKYASMCYDNTQYHISMVQALETKEEVEAYDYSVGYPEKLSF